jgi:hypothetical protein
MDEGRVDLGYNIITLCVGHLQTNIPSSTQYLVLHPNVGPVSALFSIPVKRESLPAMLMRQPISINPELGLGYQG